MLVLSQGQIRMSMLLQVVSNAMFYSTPSLLLWQIVSRSLQTPSLSSFVNVFACSLSSQSQIRMSKLFQVVSNVTFDNTPSLSPFVNVVARSTREIHASIRMVVCLLAYIYYLQKLKVKHNNIHKCQLFLTVVWGV